MTRRRVLPPEVAALLRAARGRAGLSVRLLAVAVGIGENYVTGMEQRTRRPTVAVASRLADVLGLADDERAALLAVAGDARPARKRFTW